MSGTRPAKYWTCQHLQDRGSAECGADRVDGLAGAGSWGIPGKHADAEDIAAEVSHPCPGADFPFIADTGKCGTRCRKAVERCLVPVSTWLWKDTRCLRAPENRCKQQRICSTQEPRPGPVFAIVHRPMFAHSSPAVAMALRSESLFGGWRTGAGERFRSVPRERRRSPWDEPPVGRGLPVEGDARKTAVKSEAMSVRTGSERSRRGARTTK